MRPHEAWLRRLDGGPAAPLAESEALHLAVVYLLERAVGERQVVLAGDAGAIIAYAAGGGRLRDQAAHRLLDGPLARLAAAGWRTQWRVLPRNQNETAHRLAATARAIPGAWPSEARIRGHRPPWHPGR